MIHALQRDLHSMFVRAAALLLLAGLALPGALRAQQELPADFEEGIFQLHLAQVRIEPLTALVLVSPDGEIYLPLEPLLEHAAIPARAGATDLLLEWPPPTWRTSLDPGSGAVQRDGGSFELPAGSLGTREGRLYISLPALERLLEVTTDISWERLAITLHSRQPFPVERQLAAEERRARGRLAEWQAAAEPSVPYPSRSGGAGLDWVLSSMLTRQQQSASGSLTAGMALLGGSLQAGATLSLRREALELSRHPFYRFARSFPENRFVQQLELGHVQSEGPLPLALRGVRVTNEPFVQPRLLGSILVQPVLPVGWEYEVYERGQLIGVGAAEAGEGVEVPVHYGSSPVTVRMIGPAGQERSEEMLLVVPVTRVTPGQLRYFAAAGQCASQGCSGYGALELRYGVAPRLTLGAGMDALAGTRADGLRPHLALSASPWWALTTELQARPDFVNASFQHLGGQSRTYAGRFLWSGADDPVGGLRGWRLDLNGYQTLPEWAGSRWVSLRANLQGDTLGNLAGTQVGAGTPLRRGFLYLQQEWGLQRLTLTTLRLSRSFRVPDTGRSMGLSGSVGASPEGLQRLDASASLWLGPRGAASIQMQWQPAVRPLLSLSYTARLPGAHAQLRGSAIRGTPTLAGALRGGVGASPGVGALATPHGAVGRAGITGRVFLDRSGTGSYVAGTDSPLEGVQVRAGGHTMVTDAQGIYRGWDLHPYAVTAVWLDTLRLPDPAFVPSTPQQTLRPTPNLYNRVDIPVLRTREVAGRLVRGEGVASVAGMAVELRHRGSGATQTVRTFSDGEFYVSRVLPGEYEVRVAAASLAAVSAESRPELLLVHVPAEGEEFVLSLRPLHVERPAPPEERAAALPRVHLSGRVTDAESGEPLAARLSLAPVVGGAATETTAAPSSGRYAMDALAGGLYSLQVTAPGYLPEAEVLDLTFALAGEALPRDFVLQPLRVGLAIRMENIFFDLGRATLRAESEEELLRALTLLEANPEIRVEIAGHTDATGPAELNQRLSLERAQAVADYLIARGIAAERISARGYGSSDPVAPNDTEDGRQLNRRVEMRILGVEGR